MSLFFHYDTRKNSFFKLQLELEYADPLLNIVLCEREQVSSRSAELVCAQRGRRWNMVEKQSRVIC